MPGAPGWVGRPRAELRPKRKARATGAKAARSAILESPMGHAFGLRGVAVLLLVAVPCLAKPRPRAPSKAKPVKEASAAPAQTADEAAPSPPPDAPVKAAGTKEPAKDSKAAKVTTVEESSGKDKGVKTYKFSAVEVEGRLKSPQIVYFLRRVRAEFDAGDLGHRSFMPELSDTRRSPSLR
jgi:hypothetical protein